MFVEFLKTECFEVLRCELARKRFAFESKDFFFPLKEGKSNLLSIGQLYFRPVMLRFRGVVCLLAVLSQNE